MNRDNETLIPSPPPDRGGAMAPWFEGVAPASRAFSRADVPPPPDEQLDARRVLTLLFQKKKQILLLALLVVVPAMIVTILQERLYESSTLIEVTAEPVQVLPYRDVASPSTSLSPAVQMASKEEMLKGKTLVSRVAERLKAEGRSEVLGREVSRLRAHVSVVPLPNSQMIRLGYLASDPDAAATIANTWAEEFIKANFASRQETREKVRVLLQRELATLEQQVQASERELVSYAQSHGMQRDEAGKGDLAQIKLSTLAAEVTAAESELVQAQSRLDTLRHASVTNFPEKLITPGITGRQATLRQLEHDLAGLRTSFGENWPAVVQKRNEIAVVREQLDDEKAAALAFAREQATLEFRTAESRLRALAAAKTEQEQLVAQLQDASVQYNIIRREVETNQKLYEGLLERLKQTGVAPGMEFENIRVIEPAWPNHAAARPRVLWNLFLASILGVALGFCVVVGMDFWNDTLSTIEDVESSTRLPVLGAVPLVKVGGARSLLAHLSERDSAGAADGTTALLTGGAAPAAETTTALARRFVSPPGVAEAVRSICASILLSRSEHPPRILLVTSALPGEGKTTMAAQLGLAFADSGCRTLIVECDMRRPTFGQVLGVRTEGGLSLFLAGHIKSPTLEPIVDDSLVVVGAGPVAPNPVALLHSEKMRSFLGEMTRAFRFVILDAPPVLPMADSRVLGSLAEGVLLVVRSGVTSRRDVKRACAALAMGRGSLIGTILNGAALTRPESQYYAYYGYRAS